MKIFEQEIDID